MAITQVKGSVLKYDPNLTSLSAIFGVKYDKVAFLHTSIDLSKYTLVYDESTATSWFVSGATGVVSSWKLVSGFMMVTTSTGVYQLRQAKALDIEFMFKNEQYIQYYYDMIGDWDEAIFQAQANVYLKKYSPKLVLPNAVITITKPILNGPALGDEIHRRYPELNFYNSTNGNYLATWPLIMHGVYRKQQDGGNSLYHGTQLVFSGSANRDDMTWTKWAIIHSGPNPNEVGQIRSTDPVLKQWAAMANLENFNIRAVGKDGVPISNIHGLYFHYGTQVTVRNMSIYQCYGAGVCVDNTWDSIFENLKVLQCGRMSPKFGQYITDGKLTYENQTYAPIHVMRSPLSDNSNFIRFDNCHIEDNMHAAVDVMVSGNSSPIWFNDLHVEAQTGLGGTTNVGGRTIFGLGNFGVTYFGQDADPSYVYTARPDTNTGGNIVWNGGGMYSDTYSHIVRATKYSGLVIDNCMFPNSGDISMIGGNSTVYAVLSNMVCSNVTFSGGNSHLTPLKMTNCKASSIKMDYTYGAKLSNVEVSGDVLYTNMFSNNAAGVASFSNCSLGSLNGIIQYGQGNVALTSTTVESNFVSLHGNIDISGYAYYNTNFLGGAV